MLELLRMRKLFSSLDLRPRLIIIEWLHLLSLIGWDSSPSENEERLRREVLSGRLSRYTIGLDTPDFAVLIDFISQTDPHCPYLLAPRSRKQDLNWREKMRLAQSWNVDHHKHYHLLGHDRHWLR